MDGQQEEAGTFIHGRECTLKERILGMQYGQLLTQQGKGICMVLTVVML